MTKTAAETLEDTTLRIALENDMKVNEFTEALFDIAVGAVFRGQIPRGNTAYEIESYLMAKLSQKITEATRQLARTNALGEPVH